MISKNLQHWLIGIFLFFYAGFSAQEKPKYDHIAAFIPFFYTKNGTETRSASGEPGPKYWQNRADYSLNATLNDTTREISGTAEITYTNNSPDQLKFLWLQLDQNLFKKDSRGTLMGINSETETSGGYNLKLVEVVSINGKKINTKSPYIVSDTRMKINLPENLHSNGGIVKLKIDYTFIVPMEGINRMGTLETKNGKIFSIAQWFPRMCVYDDILGWNTNPYLGRAEFYLEYGDITANITAPSNHYVVASGELLNAKDVYNSNELQRWEQAKNSDKTVMIRAESELGNSSSKTSATKTWKFKIDQTRDFAWASSPAFILDAARINLPDGKKSLAISAYPIESAGNKAWGRSTEYTKAAIEIFSKNWFPFTYPNAINVATNVSGMEYPGIVFCSSKSQGEGLWNVTRHEFGHNWFPMIVGSNERLHAWMDEGFNTFISELSDKEFNKGEYYNDNNFKRTTDLYASQTNAIMMAPDDMPAMSLGFLAYSKPAAGLKILRETILGNEVFDEAFREYIKRWAFKHPAPDDFFRTMENVSGEDLSYFWRGWFQNSWKIDQAIKSARFVNNDPKRGTIIKFENIGQLPMPMKVDLIYKDGTKKSLKFPVEIWKDKSEMSWREPYTKDLDRIEIPVDYSLPDINTENNIAKLPDPKTLTPVDLSVYLGKYQNKKYNISLDAVIENGNLVLKHPQSPPMILMYEDEDKFSSTLDGFTVQFSKDKKSFSVMDNFGPLVFERQ